MPHLSGRAHGPRVIYHESMRPSAYPECRALLLCALLTACGSYAGSRPTSLGAWTASLHHDTALREDEQHLRGRIYELAAGPGTVVLVLETRWGRSLIRSEHEAASLLIELPGAALRRGVRIPIGPSVRAEYLEGSMVPIYTARTLEGTIDVLDTSSGTASLAIDLRATLDAKGGPPRPLLLQGRVRARYEDAVSPPRQP